jgi:hypothetical protein
MTRLLEQAIARVRALPDDDQDALAALLMSIAGSDDSVAQLNELRETLKNSIERGGSYTDEEVAAGIEARLDAWERDR